MVQLGSGFDRALKKAAAGSGDGMAGILEGVMSAMADEVYKQLRADMVAEIQTQCQRMMSGMAPPVVHNHIPDTTPAVNVSAQPPVIHVELPDQPVSVQAAAAQVVVERPKRVRFKHDAEGRVIEATVG